jgi:hypothetical protein
MFKHKNDQKKLTKIALVIASVSLVINLVLAFVVFNDKQMARGFDTQTLNNHFEDWYLVHRITHCYDNNIHPCDHDQLSAWNKAHPDDAMMLKAPKIKESDF